MAIDRDAIFQALLERLSTVEGFVTVEDRVVPWSSVSPEQQPALFLGKGGERAERVMGRPPKWTLSATLYVYVNRRSRGDDTSPQRALNQMLNRVEKALERQPAESSGHAFSGGAELSTTLGGKVVSCWIVGAESDEGVLGDQSMAMVYVEMVVAEER